MDIINLKFCYKCKINKSTIEFSKNRNSKDGLQAHCKSCIIFYYKNNYKSISDYQKKYRECNKEKTAEYNKNYRKNFSQQKKL